MQPFVRAPYSLMAAPAALVVGILTWEISRALLPAPAPGHDDTSGFFQLGYPLSLMASFLLGMIWTNRPWRWPVVLFMGQAVWCLAKLPELPNLFPIFLAFMAVLAVPGIIAAYAGKWLVEVAPD